MRHLKIERIDRPIQGEFRISRSRLTQISVIVVTLSADGHQGRGECRPYTRNQESCETVTALIELIRAEIEAGASCEDILTLLPPGAARNAVDCALWDLQAKQTGQTISSRLGLPSPRPRQTAFTLSISTPEKMAKAAKAAHAFPLLKVKIGHDNPLPAIRAIVEARPDAEFIIDANEALTPQQALAFTDALKEMPIAMIEQPLAHADIHHNAIDPQQRPIWCADESLHTESDLTKLWALGYRAVNVKLDKCGGLTAGLSLMQKAKSMGFVIMAGCMVSSSLAMAPMIMLESFADYIDLDGPLLLAEDVKHGLVYEGAMVMPPSPALWGY